MERVSMRWKRDSSRTSWQPRARRWIWAPRGRTGSAGSLHVTSLASMALDPWWDHSHSCHCLLPWTGILAMATVGNGYWSFMKSLSRCWRTDWHGIQTGNYMRALQIIGKQSCEIIIFLKLSAFSKESMSNTTNFFFLCSRHYLG